MGTMRSNRRAESRALCLWCRSRRFWLGLATFFREFVVLVQPLRLFLPQRWRGSSHIALVVFDDEQSQNRFVVEHHDALVVGTELQHESAARLEGAQIVPTPVNSPRGSPIDVQA